MRQELRRCPARTGVDVSPEMVERARAAAAGFGNVRIEQADAQVHPFPPERFTLGISRFGTMFFSDPVAAFTNIGRALRPGARLVQLVWQDGGRQEWSTAIRRALAAGDGPTDDRRPPTADRRPPTADQRSYDEVRTGLLIGALFTLSLAGISMLVLALEQVRERRRPLAMMSASAVPRTVLARSLLWQVAPPVAVGVLAAIATGVLLAGLILRLSRTSLTLDRSTIGTFSAVAAVLVLLVAAATLPALRSATRLSALRTE